MPPPNPQRQRTERSRLAQLFANPGSVYVIHYACQSFTQRQAAGSPRVASIAVRNLESGATVSFSIHEELELLRAHPGLTVDVLERSMLQKFFQWLAEHKGMRFLHWNMRDSKFGFPALEHRFQVLGGTPFCLPDHNKFDLAMMMVNLYGTEFSERPHIESLARRNAFTTHGYLRGGEEPQEFEKGNFNAVLQSTLCKVTIIAEVAQAANDGTLRTKATWWALNVGRIREACELFDRNPVQAWAGVVMSVLLASFTLFMKFL